MGIKLFIKKSKNLSRVVYNSINASVARKQRRDNAHEIKQLQQIKGIHQGERCFIIGTGPSLTIEDLELLKDEITFATNRIYELFDKTDWRPTYYVNQDHNLIRTFGTQIRDVEAEMVFLPVDYRKDFTGGRYRFFVLKHKDFYPGNAPFSKDISKYLAQGFTVTYGAIQIALYMGFSEIYLVGIDHNYSITRDAHGRPVKTESVDGNYSKGMKEYVNTSNLPRIEETTISYETAEKVSAKCGVKIYNCTRGGKLEAFERKNLEDVLGGTI